MSIFGKKKVEEVIEEKKKLNIFDVVNSISYKKDFVLDDTTKSVYNQFMINKAFSMHKDTVLFANEMNRLDVSNEMHLGFLNNLVRKGNRRGWTKASQNKDIEMIKFFFKYGNDKALTALSVLKESEVEKLRDHYFKIRGK